MRITFVLPPGGLAGGIRVVAIHAGKLRERGHDVRIVSHRRPGPRLRHRLKAAVRRRRLPTAADAATYLEGLEVPHAVALRPGPVTDADVPDADVVIATWWETAYAVAALSPVKGQKFYFVQGHEVFDYLPRHISRGSYYLPLHKITIARWLAETMAREYGDADVDLVPNSVDLDLFNAPPRQQNAVPAVGLVYSDLAIKGADVSLAAIETARRTVPGLRVVAFGSLPVSRHLPLPAGARYFEKPPQARLREIYAMCDVWIMASRSEGFGLPLLEAMACRTPVVSTRTGAAPDLVEDGSNGYVVDVEDAEALGRRIAEVVSLPPEKWQAMSEAAWSRARSYSWDDAADAFEAALRRRLPGAPSPVAARMPEDNS